MSKEKAKRYNEGKTQWSLVDFKSIEPLPRVLMYGLEKYGERDNWKKSMELEDILDSATRHLLAMVGGEEIDPESGLPHSGHLMANVMFYEFHRTKNK